MPVRALGLVESAVLMPEPHGDVLGAVLVGVAEESDEAEVFDLVAAAGLNRAEAVAGDGSSHSRYLQM